MDELFQAVEAGNTERVRELVAATPALTHARGGGDRGTPLHFARDVETARVLVDAGADLEARDEDHDSTPVQWAVKRAPEVSRFLLARGAKPDIMLAAALGDRALTAGLIDENAACAGYRIGRLPEFPPIGYAKRGGTIYQWTAGFNCYAHQVAARNGHAELAAYLWQRSDERTRFLVACVTGNRAEAEARKGFAASLDDQDRELVARYCWETNTDYDAVRLMLDVGFPLDYPEHSHGYTPLHNAAWAGAGDVVELLLERGHPVNLKDPGYQATPLGWALHCCLIEKRHPEADYARVVRALLGAGASAAGIEFPTGNSGLDDALRPHFS